MTAIDLDDIQGGLIRGYNMGFLCHLVVRVADARAARRFIADAVDGADGVHRITRAVRWDSKPESCLNVGITAEGLAALGVDETSLATFPEEFRAGAIGRATKVGDVDGSSPSLWRDGFHDPDRVHVMWSVSATSRETLDRVCAELRICWERTGAFTETVALHGELLPDPDTGELGHDVHFGYRDSISQPKFEVHDEVVGPVNDEEANTPIGALLLGYEKTSFHNVQWQMPRLVDENGLDEDSIDIGANGCFNAFRILEQDVDAFEEFLEAEADRLGWNKEYIAAKLMGRWRNGVPIVLTPDHERWSAPDAGEPSFDEVETRDGEPLTDALLNQFDFPDPTLGDEAVEGWPCPIGAHIRRSNPRDARIVQRSANHTRPIVRRGMPYGPPFDPDERGDGERRGLLGSFYCASLISQFEAMMYDWINLGLIDPRITGTNCPITGANRAETSRFDIRLSADETVTLRGFPRFVETVGAAYLFTPSLSALRTLSSLT